MPWEVSFQYVLVFDGSAVPEIVALCNNSIKNGLVPGTGAAVQFTPFTTLGSHILPLPSTELNGATTFDRGNLEL